MKATIITIGDEILIGQIVDTNSVSIAKHLNAAGIVVHEKVSIGDDSTQIVRSVERALGDSNVVVITGGLGPTKDDITKKTLAGMFGCELVPDQRVADHVKRMLEGRGIEFNELNRGQAMVPACCTVLFNAHVYIFEFKLVELAPEGRALQQIQDKGYADKYRARGEPIHLIGVEFSKLQRNIVGFEVARA